jgi:ribosomal protein S6
MQYEITFITKTEEDFKIVKNTLSKSKVKIISEESLGRKKFAYSIKKEDAGYYHFIFFDIKPSQINKITEDIQSIKQVIRFLIIKYPQDIVKKIENAIYQKTKEKSKSQDKTENDTLLKEKISQDEDEEINANKKPTKKVQKKTVKSIKKKIDSKKPKVKKSTDQDMKNNEQERIKKLEEKLDELLKD